MIISQSSGGSWGAEVGVEEEEVVINGMLGSEERVGGCDGNSGMANRGDWRWECEIIYEGITGAGKSILNKEVGVILGRYRPAD